MTPTGSLELTWTTHMVGFGPTWIIDVAGSIRAMRPRPDQRAREYLHSLRALASETRSAVLDTRSAVLETRSELRERLTVLEQRTADLQAGIDELRQAQELLPAQLGGELADHLAGPAASAAEERRLHHGQLMEALRLLANRGHWSRSRIHDLRRSDGYEAAFSDSEPLISVVMATRDRRTLLMERAIPSVLGQSYAHLELIVIGDGAQEEIGRAVQSLGDPRLRYENMSYRGPLASDPETQWRHSGGLATNYGVSLARGRWVARLDDDDAYRPGHLAALIDLAQRDRVEFAYSPITVHSPQDGPEVFGRFPPEFGCISLQASLTHVGVAELFQLERLDAALGLPHDWGLCLRMMEAGVRMAMHPEPTVDLYPSRFRPETLTHP